MSAAARSAAGVGLRDADVEIQLVRGRRVHRRLVVATERSNDQVPSVILRAVPHAAETEDDD
jgi:hypothetical protein